MAWRVDGELALLSQRLVEAAMKGDSGLVGEILSDVLVDVNYVGVGDLKLKCTEIVLHEEEGSEVVVEYREFRMDVTALYAAAHSGRVDIARKLLSAGADVNQKLFRGYPTTAAAREGHCDLLGMLLNAGASQSACEEALLEASLCGQSKAVELLICSDMTRPDAGVHAFVSVSCRGFVDVVTILSKNGVDVNCVDRVLLRSAKPTLHTNVECTALVAAIINRQVSVVKYLLETGANTDFQVQLGAWSWDTTSGKELRVGPCMSEPYNELWCAVEYYESSGKILKLLLHHQQSLLEVQHHGRTLLCHAILCQNTDAVRVLLDVGANTEFLVRTKEGHEFRPIHLAARLGSLPILQYLISNGCEIDARNEVGETALMMAARGDQPDCFLELVIAGADLGLTTNLGESAAQIAKRSAFGSSLNEILSQAIICRKSICSSNLDMFSPLHFLAGISNPEPLRIILPQKDVIGDLNKRDGSGFTPVMLAAKAGHSEAFYLLVMAGADIGVKAEDGEKVGSILKLQASDELRDQLEQMLLDAVLAKVVTNNSECRALHYAARRGYLSAIRQLITMGYETNALDEDEYSPLMLAAREGHADACNLLLLRGASSGLSNSRGETALSLANRNSKCKSAGVILDSLARYHVLAGEEITKHTREGRGPAHLKTVQMLKSGLLTWGKSKRRNVVCKEAVMGPSASFLRNQRRVNNPSDGIIFRVVTITGREVHFEAGCATSLELWTRGINLILKEAACGAR